MKTTEEQIESVATMLAAAFWRGRLETVLDHDMAVEAMIKAAAEADRDHWRHAAKVAIV